MKVWRVTLDDGTTVDVPAEQVLDPLQAAEGRAGYGVYEAIDADGGVLYTGRTRHLATRLRSHSTRAPWWPFVASVRWTPCQNYAEAVALERVGISQDQGDWNITGLIDLPDAGRMRLPAPTTHWLIALYADSDTDEGARDFDNFVGTLRHHGWTLQSIATPLNITRERVRQRAACGAVDHDLMIPPPPVVATKRERPRKVWPKLSVTERAELRELQALAVQTRGRHAADHPCRVASHRLTGMLVEARVRGVRMRELAEVLGVTTTAVRARLARHGYVPNPPSQDSYIGDGTWSRPTHCKWGHDLDEHGRHVNGNPNRRQCRACERRRSIEYKARRLTKGATA